MRLVLLLGFTSIVAACAPAPKARVNDVVASTQREEAVVAEEDAAQPEPTGPAPLGTAFPELAQFVETGMSDLSEEHEATLRLLLGRLNGEETLFLPKMRICRVADSFGGTFFVLLEEPRYVVIPGSYNVDAHVFGTNWELLSQVGFSAGWRMDISDVEVLDESPLGRSVMCFKTAPFINGRGVGREYYALCSGRLVLVRLEDAKGVAIENVYGAPNHTIGPVPVELDELADAITKDVDVGLLLEALVFMGGQHLTLDGLAGRDVLSETKDLIACVDELFADSAVRDRVAALAESDNVWVRDAARLAQSRRVYD